MESLIVPRSLGGLRLLLEEEISGAVEDEDAIAD
jgi:hypothetical protein